MLATVQMTLYSWIYRFAITAGIACRFKIFVGVIVGVLNQRWYNEYNTQK
jgi:hypothetical protein